MNFLSIDCSTNIISLFLVYKDKAFYKNLQNNKYSNDLLMIEITKFFKENNLNLQETNEIFVNQGPGSFSGLRTAIATAKGICLAQKKKLFGYNYFILSATKYYSYKGFFYLIAKFRHEYFIQKFNSGLKQNINPRKISIQELIKKYKNKKKIIIKSHSSEFDRTILDLPNTNFTNLNYFDLIFLRKKGLLEYKSVKPLYLR